MARYARPQIYEETKFIPRFGVTTRNYVYHSWNRYVTKPVGSEVCPFVSFRGFGKILFPGDQVYVSTVHDDCCSGDIAGFANVGSPSGWGRPYLASSPNLLSQALNKAYDKFRDTVKGDLSDMGTNLAERHQAVDMIEKRGSQLRLLGNAIRNRNANVIRRILSEALPIGRFGYTILDHLSKNKFRKMVASAKTAGDLWLELHFGWVPLIQDIHDACQILQASFGNTWTDVSKSGTARYADPKYGAGYQTWIRGYDLRATVKLGAQYLVSNPNLHRATQLGLINPVSVAWETVPFSFVVDWFVPVGNFLSSFTDFVGIDFRNSYTTQFTAASGTRSVETGNPSTSWSVYVSAVGWQRTLGLATPVVYPKQLKGISAVRGFTAISLLLQHLRGV